MSKSIDLQTLRRLATYIRKNDPMHTVHHAHERGKSLLIAMCPLVYAQIILDTIDADIDLSKKTSTTWKELRKSESLSNFLDTHCKLGMYKVTIMKCEDPACKFHKPRRLSREEWRDLHPLFLMPSSFQTVKRK